MAVASPDPAGEPRVAEGPIAQSEMAAPRLQVANLDQKAGNLDAKVNDLAGEALGAAETIERNQAQTVDLLPQLAGRNRDAG